MHNVMVSVDVSRMGKAGVIFIEQGALVIILYCYILYSIESFHCIHNVVYLG